MARYIDADVLIKMLSNYYRQTQSLYDSIPQNGQVSRTRRALDELYRGVDVIIGRVPTAEIEEVKHGEWLYRSFSPPSNVGYQQMITCSVCASKFARLYGVHFKYCPECGAKMDK